MSEKMKTSNIQKLLEALKTQPILNGMAKKYKKIQRELFLTENTIKEVLEAQNISLNHQEVREVLDDCRLKLGVGNKND